MTRQPDNARRPPQAPGRTYPNPATPLEQRTPATSGPGFINPYNFVRFLSPIVRTDSNGPGSPPLRTHEKFAGLSGRIVVELETVTPLCIPDAEATTATRVPGDPDPEHLRYTKPFCRVDGRPYIPGSELKGMLRSVAEAASNSCFSVLTKNMAVFRDNRSYVQPNKGVGLLSSAASGMLQLNDPTPGQQNASNIQFLRMGLFNQIDRSYQPRPNNPKARGQTVRAEIRKLYEDMVRDDNFTLEGHRPDHDGSQQRWLLNFVGNDPWWFRRATIRVGSGGAPRHEVISLGRNFRYKWAYDPRKAVPEALHPCKEPHRLCPCCALFGMAEQRENGETDEARVKAFAGRVAIGPARWTGGKCDSGWANDYKILGTPKFSCRSFYLEPSPDNKTAFDVSNDEFVYLDDNDKVRPNQARGRKFYWHHTRVWENLTDLSYLERLPLPNGNRPAETHQNGRIEALLPEARFEFAIEFENLSDWELGLLLWTIALPDVTEGAHHLGLGKPIGLGTVTLRIKHLDLINRYRRYNGLFDTGVEPQENLDPGDEDGLGRYVKAFRDKMESWYGQPFGQLPNVEDLLVILSRREPAPASSDVRIVYPPGDRFEPSLGVNEKELHYQWFGGKRWSEPLLDIQQVHGDARQML